MYDEESSNANFTKQKQEIESQSPADNNNQTIDLENALLEMK